MLTTEFQTHMVNSWRLGANNASNTCWENTIISEKKNHKFYFNLQEVLLIFRKTLTVFNFFMTIKKKSKFASANTRKKNIKGVVSNTLVPEVFFHCEEMRQGRKKQAEKTSGCG